MHKTIISGIDASDSYAAHKVIATYFDEAQHVWRRDGETVTVVSADKPTGILGSGMCLGSFEIQAPKVGDVFPVMLRVSACKHAGKQRVALTAPEIREWLAAHMPGMVLTDVNVMAEAADRSTKQEHGIVVRSYSVAAMVEVVDADAATAVLMAGVGRARRFGFGLVLPLR